MSETNIVKICKNCKRELPLDNFYKHYNDIRSRCKQCLNEQNKQKRIEKRGVKPGDPVGDPIDEHKWCRKCLKWRPESDFYKLKTDKLYSYCRECSTDILKNRRIK